MPEVSQEHKSHHARSRIGANSTCLSTSHKSGSLMEAPLVQIILSGRSRVTAVCYSECWQSVFGKMVMQAKNNSRTNSYFYHGFSKHRVRPVVSFQQDWKLRLRNLVLNLFFSVRYLDDWPGACSQMAVKNLGKESKV